MRFAVLGSGSKGNALVVEGGGRRVLVDCGYGPRELKRRLAHLELDLRSIDALLLTHGHGDHIKGARQLAGSLGIPTFATQGTQRFCVAFGGLRNVVPIIAGQRFEVGGLAVLPVATPHDAPGSVCFVINDGDGCVGVCTDLGAPADEVGEALRACQSLVLEHNHDVGMLQRGPYTPALKRRIASPRGHLSNEEGARLLSLARHPGLTRVLLAHLSEVNNTPQLALDAARAVVDGADIELAIAPQHHPTGWLRANRRRAATVEVEVEVRGASAEPAASPSSASPSSASPSSASPSSASPSSASPSSASPSSAAPLSAPSPTVSSPSVSLRPSQDGAGPTRHAALEAQLALFARSPSSSRLP